MGESRRKRQGALNRGGGEAEQLQAVDTLGGRMHLGWDAGAAAAPHGQLVFFAEFLAATGVFDRRVSRCPLAYTNGNAPDKRDVLGTLMLRLLAGHRRCAHITALRGDAVAAQVLGMNKVVSEDALRRALERIDEPASTAWMRPALIHSVREALSKPWVLDFDASVKPRYGLTSRAARWSKTRCNGRAGARSAGWSSCASASRAASLASGERRVDGKQLRLDLAGPSVHEGERLWGYAVMVTDAAYPIVAIGQLYRDRADCENGFDELKNQWGLSGFTTQDINRCQTTARACALVYNGWSWYGRAANPRARMEAVTSRPLLLAAVGRETYSGGQTTLYLTPLHGKANLLKPLIANIHAALQCVKAAAEQFKAADRGAVLVRDVSDRIVPTLGPFKPPPGLPAPW